jgi:DNA-directed RNA polymerase specialized sigma24 family protein
MDQLGEFCARMLGDRGDAADVARAARTAGGEDELVALQHAVKLCRERIGSEPVMQSVGAPVAGGLSAPEAGGLSATEAGGLSATEAGGLSGPDTTELAKAVAAELSLATARLAPRQREALALRELLGLSHEKLSFVLGIEPAAAAPLLARSRLRLRAELRGAPVDHGDCAERDRTLRVATLRQDSEQVPTADDDWLIDHLGHCEDCIRAHAAMLEGSACYRGWRSAAYQPQLAADARS